MPHLHIEYSANLGGKLDMAVLCERMLAVLLQTGLFEEGAVRVRAYRADAFAVADGHRDNAFVDMSLRIGTGRSAQDKRRAGEALFEAAAQASARLFDSPHFALSLEIREIDALLSWKRNSMHARLRGKPG